MDSKSPVRKMIKTRSSSQSPNVKTESNVLKSTNNIATSVQSNDVTNIVIQTKSNPQVSYRVVNLNPSNSTLVQTTASATSNPQILVMVPSNPNNNNNNNNNNNQNSFVKKGETFTTTKNLVDQKRRMTHREIERRRRDKINDWIYELSKEVPDCATDRTKQGQSKGGILAKTVKYIRDLRAENISLRSDVERLKRRLTDIEENRIQYKEEPMV
ncbi:uncharacterized protein LOC113798382 isoform X1 [Dermatophagoides pteronyssinus]|uniref:uncharacterized protein LOC113798382 isoform X1 n=1 Tax=Dermatophagoides pteronyssinus TaxID=6956 RepID=UPI003F661315